MVEGRWLVKDKATPPPVLGVGYNRKALHRWLMRLAARIRPNHPDILFDRLRPDGKIAQTFLDVGLALLRAGQINVARMILERGVRAFPENLALIQAAAPLTIESGHFASATSYWEAAAQGAPDDPRIACGLSASCRADFQPSRASLVIEAAVERFPGDLGVLAEAARVAAVRGRHQRALDLWNDHIARGAVSLEAYQGRIAALVALGEIMAATAAAETASRRFPDAGDFKPRSVTWVWIERKDVIETNQSFDALPDVCLSEVPITPGELMLEFESLGDNCEFGLVQRYCGINPLGLFRFTESHAEHLDHAFSTRFEHYGTDEDLIIDHLHGDEEYLGASRYYGGFKYHTEVCAPNVDVGELRKTELRKLAYLKRRMLSDLETGEKILVRKQGNYPAAMALFKTIRAMGPSIFLWVDRADHDHPVGHVEVVEPGLLRAFVAKFAWYGDARALELDGWLKVCLNALAAAKALKGERVRYQLPNYKRLQTGCGWDITRLCRARHVTAPTFDGQSVQELTLLEETKHPDSGIAVQIVEAPVVADLQIVFSVWVLIPTAFRGSWVEVYFSYMPPGYTRRADLGHRDVWQRVYTTNKMPKDCDRAALTLRVVGCAQDVVYVAGWCLEEGFVPAPWQSNPIQDDQSSTP